ncbi:cell division protein FtsZ [bacterium]|nr:cell division protein FtsZ [bacterium]
MIEFAQEDKAKHISVAKIYVVGIGGAGGNTINCMKESDYQGVSFIAVNTDAQALTCSKADKVIQIGQKSTKGLGAGANPEIGRRAAEEDIDKVLEAVQGADIVFLTAGMGGGTGSGALPVVVKALKERGILTIVVVTKPFSFEGKRRARIAEEAIKAVREHADTILIVPNQKLLNVVDSAVSMIDGFAMINEILNQSVKSISDIITRAGHINVDFADVREIMRAQGLAIMGTGRAKGLDRARKAALEAISSPLLENMDIAGARGVLINITGSVSLGLHEISEAALVVYEKADEEANIILGSVIDEAMGDELSVTVIATGFKEQQPVEFVKPLIQEAVSVQAQEVVQEIIQPVLPAVEQVIQVAAQPVIQPIIQEAIAPIAQPIVQAAPTIELVQEEVCEPVITCSAAPIEHVAQVVQEELITPALEAQDLVEESLTQQSYEGDSCALQSLEVQKVDQIAQEQELQEHTLQDRDALYQQEEYRKIQDVVRQHEQSYSTQTTAELKNFDIPAFMRNKKDRQSRQQRRENRHNGHKGQW